MDEMAIAFQHLAEESHRNADRARDERRWTDSLNAQIMQAYAFRQQWIWRFGNIMGLEAA